ncbi:MAG: flagellar basal-body MS-ring/collar protein FliF [Thermaerobacterales bacterium]
MEVNGLWEKIADWFRELGPWQKAALTGGIAGTLLIVLLAYNAQVGGDYGPLFAELGPDDAAAMVMQLEERGIPFKLSGQGTTIMVPTGEIYRTRLLLAGEGLPRGGVVGMEVLDRFQFGTTEFERRINFMRALQGELTRTIRQIDGVEDARIHVVMPEQSLFVSQRQPATAAVLLNMRPGSRMDPTQVQAIANLVAGSVENLQPSDVTVIDVHGRILSDGIHGDEGAAGARPLRNLEMQTRFQEDLQKGVQTLLEQVFGPGNVVARVNAELDFDETSINRQFFEPVADTNAMLRSVQELEERFEGSGGAGGAVGTDGNIPTYIAPAGAQEGNYERNESVRNYELNEIREQVQVAPGRVSRLSVSVVVNEELNEGQIAAIHDTVAGTIGFDDIRNDQITVLGIPFDTSIADQMRTSMDQQAVAQEQQQRTTIYAAAAAGVIVLILAVMLMVWIRRRLGESRQQVLLDERVARERPRAQPYEEDLELSELAETGGRSREKQFEKLANDRPEDVAQIVRAWLVDDRN